MESTTRPPPASNLSSSTNESLGNPTVTSVDEEQTRSQDDRPKIPNGWVMARKSRIPSKAWNRQSVLVFADFNNFDESPTAEQDNEHLRDISSRPASIISSTSSSYSLDKELPEPPYHVFTLAKKKQLVYIVSLAGLFSPLSSNIYFPALGQIATDLKTSVSLISLTITIYMVVQGLAPSFWGPLSDTQGRRITFIGTFAVYLVANIGLGLSNSFAALMIFRGIQAAGSAATISVGAGVIGDITTARERGGLIGIFGGIRMMGQSIGPVFGGILTQYLGFRSIFWFLFGLGSIALFLILFLLPETLRSIAGNGTLRLSGVHRPFIHIFSPPPEPLVDHDRPPKAKVTLRNIVAPLKFLFEKDVFITLFFGSIVYTVWSMVTSSTTSLFQSLFHLNNLQVGLAFLPNGAGCVAGSYLTGYLMDHDYRVTEAQYRISKNIQDTKLNTKDLADFPIEKSRLRNIWWIVLIFITATAAYGFSLKMNRIAIPLILQFFIAYMATAVFSLNSALVIDLYPGASASATAVNNLMRCSVGAIGVAVVQVIIDKAGVELTFLSFAGLTALTSPLLLLEWLYGMEWRMERRQRLSSEEEKRTWNSVNEKAMK